MKKLTMNKTETESYIFEAMREDVQKSATNSELKTIEIEYNVLLLKNNLKSEHVLDLITERRSDLND
tara:strand:+ start:129 stop:329 length:201 start_codon:yes stop_codon:yes gene_type:complete